MTFEITRTTMHSGSISEPGGVIEALPIRARAAVPASVYSVDCGSMVKPTSGARTARRPTAASSGFTETVPRHAHSLTITSTANQIFQRVRLFRVLASCRADIVLHSAPRETPDRASAKSQLGRSTSEVTRSPFFAQANKSWDFVRRARSSTQLLRSGPRFRASFAERSLG